MKVNRLFSIVHILLNKERVTAKELAENFEVSTRTIYRDIDTLSMSGIPIYTDRGSGGGISLLDNFVLNKSVISEEEKNSILLGLEVLEATKYDEVDTAIKNLKSLFDADKDKFIEVDFSGFDNEAEMEIFKEIKHALKGCFTLSIIYKNNQGSKSDRMINPLKLVFKQQRWYLIAFCNMREECRTFRVSRIAKARVNDNKFNRGDYDIENYVLTSYDIKNVQPITLTLDKSAYYRVEEEFHLGGTVTCKDDVLYVRFETEVDEWISNYILSYADYLIDIEPGWLKEKVKDKAKKIVNL